MSDRWGISGQGRDGRRVTPSMVALRLLVLDFVHEYIARWRCAPSLGEIAAELAIERNHARKAIMSLAASGLVIRSNGHRGIVLPDQRAMAIRTLRSLGWQVDDASQNATNRALMEGPPIDYCPLPEQGDGHGGRARAQG